MHRSWIPVALALAALVVVAPTASAEFGVGACTYGVAVVQTNDWGPDVFVGVVVELPAPHVYTNYHAFVHACP